MKEIVVEFMSTPPTCKGEALRLAGVSFDEVSYIHTFDIEPTGWFDMTWEELLRTPRWYTVRIGLKE